MSFNDVVGILARAVEGIEKIVISCTSYKLGVQIYCLEKSYANHLDVLGNIPPHLAHIFSLDVDDSRSRQCKLPDVQAELGWQHREVDEGHCV